MFKKNFFIIFAFIFFASCEYKPIYSDSNKSNFKIIINELSGDKKFNRFLVESLKRSDQRESSQIININIDTQYTKVIVAKDTAGNVTDYQIRAITSFIINQNQTSRTFMLNEKFNFQKMSDKYEEKSYEEKIKKNLAETIAQKLIFRLSIPQ